MSDAYAGVIILSIAALIVGALIFGGSFLVYNLGNRQTKVGDTDDTNPSATDAGRATPTSKHP